MPVTFRASPQRQKVVDLASRQSNQKQIYHFLYSARHFLGCAGVRFSGGQVPQTYSSEAAARGKPERSAQAARYFGLSFSMRAISAFSFRSIFGECRFPCATLLTYEGSTPSCRPTRL